VIATQQADIRAGSTLAKEVGYLLDNGYNWAENGMSPHPEVRDQRMAEELLDLVNAEHYFR